MTTTTTKTATTTMTTTTTTTATTTTTTTATITTKTTANCLKFCFLLVSVRFLRPELWNGSILMLLLFQQQLKRSRRQKLNEIWKRIIVSVHSIGLPHSYDIPNQTVPAHGGLQSAEVAFLPLTQQLQVRSRHSGKISFNVAKIQR